jgi:hypothetical protein
MLNCQSVRVRDASAISNQSCFFAQVKEHYIPPDTKQRVEDTIMVLLLMLALYVAFRLMKYSFARR